MGPKRSGRHGLPLKNSPSRTRTYDSAVNSRVLYRLSYRGIKGIYLQNCTLNFFYSLSFILQEITSSYLSLTITFWLSPRPISNSQLHVLLRFHLCPIYLVVFKGSYYLRTGYLILRGASRLDAFSVYPCLLYTSSIYTPPMWMLNSEQFFRIS